MVLDHGSEGHRVELKSVVTSERLCIARGLAGGRVREELDVNLLGFVRVGASSRRRSRNASRFDIGWGVGRLEADKRQLRITNAIGKRLGYFRRGSTAHAVDVQVHRLLHRAGSICQGLAALGACLSGRYGVELHESSWRRNLHRTRGHSGARNAAYLGREWSSGGTQFNRLDRPGVVQQKFVAASYSSCRSWWPS